MYLEPPLGGVNPHVGLRSLREAERKSLCSEIVQDLRRLQQRNSEYRCQMFRFDTIQAHQHIQHVPFPAAQAVRCGKFVDLPTQLVMQASEIAGHVWA